MSAFADHVVVVTGAGQGIGFALCQAFAQSGAWVFLNDLRAEVAEEAADRLNSALGQQRVSAAPGDVADVERVRALIAQAAARHGRLDVVIANAGITNFGEFLEYTPQAFDRLTSVNLRGTYFTAQAAARQMIAGGHAGRILLTSSVTGVQAYRNLSAYGLTKAGIVHMARSLAVELGAHRITVNAICPGATLTERTLLDDPAYAHNWAGVTPSGRASSVDDIAAAALFLASPAAAQITGQTLTVDGGWTLQSPIPPETPDNPQAGSALR